MAYINGQQVKNARIDALLDEVELTAGPGAGIHPGYLIALGKANRAGKMYIGVWERINGGPALVSRSISKFLNRRIPMRQDPSSTAVQSIL